MKDAIGAILFALFLFLVFGAGYLIGSRDTKAACVCDRCPCCSQ